MGEKKPQQLYTQISNQSLNKDLVQLYDYVSRLEFTTDNPDGVRKGRYKGEAVYLQSGGKHYLEVYTGTTTIWKGVELTNVP